MRKELHELGIGQSDTNSTNDPLKHLIFSGLPISSGSNPWAGWLFVVYCAEAIENNEKIKNTIKRRLEQNREFFFQFIL